MAKYHLTNTLAASLYRTMPVTSPDDCLNLDLQTQGVWYEWIVAQELLRRQHIAGKNFFEPPKYWQATDHELDFFNQNISFIEVKRGSTSPFDFKWFCKTFPNDSSHVVSASSYDTSLITSQSLHDFLMDTSYL